MGPSTSSRPCQYRNRLMHTGDLNCPFLPQDVSRLVDLCRQSIVFESPGGVAACLAAIAADPTVALCRVKNRLDPKYDAAKSAGYRDVGLNLRMVGPDL